MTTTKTTDQPNMRSFVRTWQQNGVTLSAAIAPCSWMYNSPLQVIVKIGDWTGGFKGTEHVYDSEKRFAGADADEVPF